MKWRMEERDERSREGGEVSDYCSGRLGGKLSVLLEC